MCTCASNSNIQLLRFGRFLFLLHFLGLHLLSKLPLELLLPELPQLFGVCGCFSPDTVLRVHRGSSMGGKKEEKWLWWWNHKNLNFYFNPLKPLKQNVRCLRVFFPIKCLFCQFFCTFVFKKNLTSNIWTLIIIINNNDSGLVKKNLIFLAYLLSEPTVNDHNETFGD